MREAWEVYTIVVIRSRAACQLLQRLEREAGILRTSQSLGRYSARLAEHLNLSTLSYILRRLPRRLEVEGGGAGIGIGIVTCRS